MSTKDKPGPPPEPVSAQSSLRNSKMTSFVAFIVIVSLLAWHSFDHVDRGSIDDVCPQASALIPEKNYKLWESLSNTYSTDSFKLKAINWLSGAVQVPTECHDDFGPVGTEPRWEKFRAFHDYLLVAFPLVHVGLELTKVNTYGLIFVWKGSDNVVPVEPTTVDQWTHPPFSGYFDGQMIWGRGSIDYKGGLIGIIIETMLENGYKPTRTVVLAFGFDEESGGAHGAQTLAVELKDMFGENGYAMLVDEGFGYGEQFGRVTAMVPTAEKGSMDVRVEVKTPGGHSCLPPPNTSIGILAQLLVEVEANPFKHHLVRSSPMYKVAQCLAVHSPDLPKRLRKDIIRSKYSDKALRSAEKQLFADTGFKARVSTIQAIDMVQGGVKVNALPEQAWAVINHRISTESSVDETRSHIINLFKSLANAFNLSYVAFGASITDSTAPVYGNLTLSDAFEVKPLEPSPVTPSDGAAPFELLSGTIKATFNSHRRIEWDDNIIVTPGIMPCNTDTRYYSKLTPHILRYGHLRGTVIDAGVHTVNEAISADNFMEIIRFFTTLILNADESALL
ncbi:hypothetical protein SCLCIDRAFT_1039128 [Scleroderma citrinum Foug A]|uniref:Peptidase M20 dimerisation domain-containing protein n=1 Tax=Scleroderma citrinum Foug A TaxID=1036808 RepID=A0A0C3DT48_9AGAM|nr:hypothetical protein SCLCIDRAFT_1039128 [Scleroderma citrinum Foug A]